MFRLVITDSDGNTIGYNSDNNNPIDLKHEVIYNEIMSFYTITMPTVFKFYGEVYQYLFDKFLGSYCEKLYIKIYKQGEVYESLIFDGYLFVTDCKFNTNKCEVEISFTNSSWQSKIENNWEVAVNLKAEQTKNSVVSNKISLVAPTQRELCDFTFWVGSEPTPVVNSSAVGYDLKDVFTHIVSYISDNSIGFESTWYDTLQIDQRIIVTNGVLYRTGSGDAPFISLQSLFTTIQKLFDVIILFDVDGFDITMRVEHSSYLQANGHLLDLSEIKESEITIDQSKLYNSVKVGSTLSMQTNSEILPTYQYPILNGYSFSIETFALQSECNTQNQLDLTIDWVVDTNILQKSRTSEDHDGDIFLIQYNSDTNCPTYGDPQGFSNLYNADYYYNQMFTNNNILSRHSLYGNLAIHLQDSDDVFLASNYGVGGGSVYTYQDTTPVDYVHNEYSSKIRYKNDYAQTTLPNGLIITPFDSNNNYGNGTFQGSTVTQANSIFECPQSGFYKFEAMANFNVVLHHLNLFAIEHTFIRRDGAGVEIERKSNRYAGRLVTIGTSISESGYGISGQQLGIEWRLWTVGGQTENAQVNVTSQDIYKTYYDFTDKNVKVFYMEAGDTMEVEIYVAEYAPSPGTPSGEPSFIEQRPDNIYLSEWPVTGSGTYFTLKPYYFACTETVNGGSAIITSQTNDVYIYEVSFDHWLTDSDVTNILSSSNVRAYIESGQYFANGIVKNLTVNHKDNLCKFVVSTNKINARQ